ncbi:cobalamin B12-binding domain-containing protein [Actinoplanes friuliensis]|jgi:methylaspartate mutase sigma subunit|uniref:B12 binding domain protein n=2 Tax=Actinoplanes friuliensis TaxID=196914 RepID=U5W221_9ACTN|nr:cobalamin-dependent protein [Actinoplanes friuliensis]AGZ41981.1 B12 binding domain protein [Actinoplanes friuliensis DSM 7358]CAD32909.1 glutamate mutase subunit A [Actinoplanes friuliensis]
MNLTYAIPGPSILVTGTSSDSHTWNLVYLQLMLEEMGCRVHNLGACVPPALVAAECLGDNPDLVVVSSVNGHGFHDGLRLIEELRARPELAGTPVVIGGKLSTDGLRNVGLVRRLRAAGYDAVFENGDLTRFRTLVGRLSARVAS